MQVGLIGLGRMGMNMAKRLLEDGHEVIVYNRSREKVDQMTGEGAGGAYSLAELAEKLSSPRIIWIMLPAGNIVDDHIDELAGLLNRDDIIIEGGNSYYKDDIRRFESLSSHGIRYMDVGVSGGIWGYEIGYCTMAGGEREVFNYLEPLFKTLAPEGGYIYCGGVGAGHFVKMVHNGIEYGMMQAYGEGFDILEHSPYSESLDYSDLSRVWNQGSVIRSWLLELAEKAFREDPKIESIKGYVADSGEGRWTVQQAVESGVPAPVIALSLMNRFRSQRDNSFSDRVLAALRREFGGHEVVSAGDNDQ